MKPKNRFFFPTTLCFAIALIPSVGTVSAANLYWDGLAGNWSDATLWSELSNATTPNPSAAPGSADISIFNRTNSLGGVAVTLNGDQSALGIQFNNTSGMSLRSTVANQLLSLGTIGLTYGTGQVDLGGSGAGAMIISLAASQSWTGSGTSLIQLTNGAASKGITNGTNGAVTLTFAGAGTGSKTINAIIDNGILGGTIGLTINTTGAFGTVGLGGNNTYTGGTTLTQGFLGLNNALALGGTAGALTINGAALTGSGSTQSSWRTISSSVVNGVSLTNNNAQNWNASDFALGGGQDINFGTGAITLGANVTIRFAPGTIGSSALNYTYGGNISGEFSLETSTRPYVGNTNYLPGISSALNLSGTNSYTGGTTITNGLVRFVNSAAIPTTGQVVINGGALAVGNGTAFSNLAAVASNANVTRTAGSLALTTDSSENFTAPNANISVGAALGSTVKYTGTITTSGNNYNVGGGGGTIVFSNANAFTGAKSIATNGAVASSTQGGGGTVIITGINNATGNGAVGVSIGQGVLQVDSIGSLNGVATNLGQFTTAANGAINFGASSNWSLLRYTGLGETTDRNLNWNAFSGANAGFDASGTGAVSFTGVYTTANSSSKNLTLRGINTGANTTTAGIGTQAVNAGSNAWSKQQRGNWTVSGSNNVSGLTISGGTLTADYANVATVFTTSTPNLTLGGGALSIKGNVAGTTTQTIGNLTTTASTGQSQITVTGNGSANTANLTIGNTWTRNAVNYVNFNLFNGGTITSNPTAGVNQNIGFVKDGVLVAGTNATGTLAPTTGFAAYTVTDSSGSDFATITGGEVVKVGAATALPTSGSVNTTNYVLNSGTTTMAGAAAVNTLRIDSSGGTGTLVLGSNNITTSLASAIVLMSGVNDYTISGTRVAGAGATFDLANYGAGKLTMNALVTDGSGVFNKTGPGLVDFGIAQTYTGATNIFGGVLRVSSTIGNGNITLNTGGIYEIATGTTFNRTVGTGTSQVQWTNGDGGFSAFGGNRTVALTNALGFTTGQLVWGSTSGNNFVTAPNASPNFVKDGFALLLGSSVATGTVDFQNSIDFVNMPRTVEVAKGAGFVAVDAVLSGILSSSDFSGGLYKTGTGTLALTSTNTYTGQTAINAGTVQLGNAGTTGSINVNSVIVNNATLAVNRSNAVVQGADFSAAALTGSGNFTQAGTGTTTLNAANTYTGKTSASAGTLQFAKLNSLASNLNTKTTAASGATLAFNVGGLDEFATTDITTILTNLTGSNAAGQGFQAGSSLALDTTNASGSTFTLADNLVNSTGAAGGAIGLTKLGRGTLVLTGNNSYTGGTNLNAGTLNFGVGQSGTGGPLGGDGGVNSSIGIIKFLGGTLQFGATNTVDYSSRFSGAASQAFNINTNGQAVAFGTAISSTSGTFNKIGTGTLSLTSNSNAWTGVTTISGGTLQLGNNGTTGRISTSSAIVNNGILFFNRSNNVVQGTDFSNTISGSGSLVFSAINNSYAQSSLTSATNSYTGTTTISNGYLNVGASSLLSGVAGPLGNATSAIILGDANTVASAYSGSGPNVVLVVTGANVVTDSSFSITRDIDSTASANVSGRNDIAFNSANAAGIGTLTVSGNWSLNTGNARSNGLWAQKVGQTLDFTGIISGGNSATSLRAGDFGQGVGIVRLSNASNSYTSQTVVTSGTLLIAGNAGATSGVLGANAAMTVGNFGGSASALTDGAFTVAKIITLDEINLGTNTWTLGGNTASDSSFTGNVTPKNLAYSATLNLSQVAGGTVTFSGVIGANPNATFVANIAKVGAGTVVLSGDNLYDGTTTIQSGILNVTGSLASASAVTVGGAGSSGTPTLAGNGTIGGATIIAAAGGGVAGAHSVGDRDPSTGASMVGSQNFSSSLSYGSGSIFDWDFDSISASDPGVVADGDAGIYDQVVAAGAVTGGTAIFKVVLATGDSFTDAFWNTDKSWSNIFTGAGAPSLLGSVFNAFDASGGLDSSGNVAGRGQFTFNGSSATLTWTAVPEPSSALAGLLLAGGLLRRRRGA